MIHELILPFVQETLNSLTKELKIIVINNANNLSLNSQYSLRRIMETYLNVRYIFCSNNTNRIIFPIKSRCIDIPVENPNLCDLYYLAVYVLQSEKVSIKYDVLFSMIYNSRRNLKKLFIFLELYVNKIFRLDSLEKTTVNELIRMIKSETLIVTSLRSKLYALYTSNINVHNLIKELYYLLEGPVNYYIKCSNGLMNGKRNIMHLELLCIKLHEYYKFHYIKLNDII
jgi:hypothetical protein